MDCKTPWEPVATGEKISEAYWFPVIQRLLDGFPFRILGFHADNGSAYINHPVAKMLDELRVEFTQSCPYPSNDNGAVVRKPFGYAPIPQHGANQVKALCRGFLNPYLNVHRPGLFPESVTDAQGKIQKRYPLDRVITPFEKLKSIPAMVSFFKPTIPLCTRIRVQTPG